MSTIMPDAIPRGNERCLDLRRAGALLRGGSDPTKISELEKMHRRASEGSRKLRL
jgi:hypothetical protein